MKHSACRYAGGLLTNDVDHRSVGNNTYVVNTGTKSQEHALGRFVQGPTKHPPRLRQGCDWQQRPGTTGPSLRSQGRQVLQVMVVY